MATVPPLHFYLRDRGRVLATRTRGREAADHLRDLSRECGDVIVDFESVEVASATFLQELVDALQNIIQADPDTGRIIVGVNMNEDVSETLGSVLGRRKLMIPYVVGDAVQLLEGNPQVEETLRAAQRLGPSFTAPELAEELEINADTATKRLKRLLVVGAVTREEDPEASRGVRHRYRPATAEILERSREARPATL